MNWHKELAATRTEADVVAVAQEYLEALPKWLLCFIPRDCILNPVVAPEDLLTWSQSLTTRFADSAITVQDVKVQDLVVFFVRAASRVAELNDGPWVANGSVYLSEELVARADSR